MFTDRNGRPCQASDDSLVAAMFRLMPRSLEETAMFANEGEGFQVLYDRLMAYSSTKQSLRMSESKTTRNDDPIDVHALNKGKSKGKGKKGSSGKGKGSKGQNSTSNVVCWYCVASMDTTRGAVDKSGENRSGSETGAQSYEHADGWTWGDEHVDGLWKTSDWKTGTGSGWWTTANDRLFSGLSQMGRERSRSKLSTKSLNRKLNWPSERIFSGLNSIWFAMSLLNVSSVCFPPVTSSPTCSVARPLSSTTSFGGSRQNPSCLCSLEWNVWLLGQSDLKHKSRVHPIW